MAHDGLPTGLRSPGPAPIANERGEQRRDLASWWKNFKRSDKKTEQQVDYQGIFGVPLHTSIRYANVAISLFNDEGQSYIYGYVPIVVAKCGVYLKEKATDVEGIFRLAGSEKRIKELKVAFDSPDRYGKGLDWTGYTVHDAANILRRYFNQLPEPIIPLEFYERFREPLRNHQAQAVSSTEGQNPVDGSFDQESAIRAYQALITELPPLNRQLLLYILDLLAVFASKSDLNKMTTPNLAAIFQPGILSHPQHDMAPQEYRLSQDVLIFLIENQDSFLIGMQGTAADPETVRHVQSGTPPKGSPTPTTPTRAKTLVARSSSNASAGAESVRKWGNLRRNVSVSSKHSQRSQLGPNPVGGGLNSPGTPTTSGVHRSNTVPSRRTAGSAASPRFSREKSSDPSTPTPPLTDEKMVEHLPERGSLQATPIIGTTVEVPAAIAISAASSEATTPLAAPTESRTTSVSTQTPKRESTPLLKTWGHPAEQSSDKAANATPSTGTGHGFLNIFNKSPTSDGESRKPNKLQKRRTPGSTLSSAHSSSHSLGNESEPLSSQATAQAPRPPTAIAEVPSESSPPPSQAIAVPATPQRNPTDATLRPSGSPTRSYHSHTDFSDADLVGDDMPPNGSEDQPEREKKRHRWRFSRSQNKMEPSATPGSGNPLGMMTAREQTTSFSTVGSSQPRKSFQEASLAGMSEAEAPMGMMQSHNTDPVFSDSERERKGPVSWIRGKLQERKENKEAERRARTPERRHGERVEYRPDGRHPSESLPSGRQPTGGQERPFSFVESSAAPAPIVPLVSPSANATSIAHVSAPKDEAAPAPVVPFAQQPKETVESKPDSAPNVAVAP